jgi:hypothetical protein
MRKFNWLLLTAILGLPASAVAQEAEAPPADAPADASAPGEGSVDTVNEPVKEAAANVEDEMSMDTSKVGKYGSAGCGLGSLLFEPSNGFTQVFAATTNGTSGTQTFGISSGTSNCDGAGYQPGSTTAFIQSNRSALAKDIVRGKGATISGLADLAGCGSSKAVGQTLKKNFKAIFPNAAVSDQQVSDSVLRVLKSESSLTCSNLV